MEWVAFEKEHALQFAHLFLAPPPGPPLRGIGDVVEVHSDTKILTVNENKQHVIHPKRQPFGPDLIWILPGYLHSYSARKDLRLVYLDGSAAAKTNKGTLDTSDLLLLNDSRARIDADHDRAHRLCQIAAKDWSGRIDGFIRMEAGFEIIICSFADSLDLVEALRMEGVDDGGTRGESADVFHWLRAAAARYNGIGGSPPRVQLNYDAFLTAYAYSIDLFQNDTTSTTLPRLAGVPQNILDNMRHDLNSIILRSDSFVDITHRSHRHDWQAVADMIVQRYAKPLQWLVTSPELNQSSTRLAQELNYILRPFFDTAHRDAETETRRCAVEFMPPYSRSRSGGPENHDHSNVSLAEHAVYAVSHHICSTLVSALWSLYPSPSSAPACSDHEHAATRQIASLRDLTDYLAWTEWKKCTGCAWNEICSIPMFPFGVAADHERPRCRGVDSIGEGPDYWRENSF